MVQFDGCDWDVGNRGKCQKHGVSIAEVESLFSGDVQVSPDPTHSGTEQRFKAIGRSTAGCRMFLAFTWRRREGRVPVRAISASFMHDGEVRFHEALTSAHER